MEDACGTCRELALKIAFAESGASCVNYLRQAPERVASASFRMSDKAFLAARPLEPSSFEGEVDGKPVRLFTLRNGAGMAACITNYGAKIEQLCVPDRHGQFDDVVLGYDSLDGVMNGAFAVGAFVGRYAGRIENARFTLDGTAYPLSANDGTHCLHGGAKGSFCRVFDAVQRDAGSVEMSYLFADGEEGFPGTLALRLNYRLGGTTNELVVDYEAVALDKPTVASFTTHAFFNLNGAASGSILNHEVMIAAERYFGMTPELIATGALLPVENTAFDLRQPTLLSSRVRGLPAVSGLLAASGPAVGAAVLLNSSAGALLDGYDDCFLVNRTESGASAASVGAETGAGRLALCARVRAPQTGRVMEVWSTEPALQFYTGLRPDEALPGPPGKGGRTYFEQMGFCFEPEGYPNAPNRPEFPSAVCEPGKRRTGRTVYRFSTEFV